MFGAPLWISILIINGEALGTKELMIDLKIIHWVERGKKKINLFLEIIDSTPFIGVYVGGRL